jgi:hypothetical protein
MEERIKGSTILYIMLMLSNLLLGFFGLSLLILGILIWNTSKSFNSIILLFILMFIILSCIFILGCYVKYSPTSLLIYLSINLLMTITILVISFILIIDKDIIVDYLMLKMEDSKEEIKQRFDRDLGIIKILFMCSLIIFVRKE